MAIKDEGLKRLVKYKVEKLEETLKDQVICMELQEDVENGEDVFFILIVDKEQTLSTIRCNSEGWAVKYEYCTPRHIKTKIEKAMVA